MTGVASMAVVHSPDGIRFVTTASSRDAVVAQLAGYVRDRCDDMLAPAAGRRVRDLLAAGNLEAAVAVYFAHVGERWDDERLALFLADEDGSHWTPEEGSCRHVAP